MLCFRMVSAWGYLSSEGVQVLFGTRGDELPAQLEVLEAFLYAFPYTAAKGKNDSPLH